MSRWIGKRGVMGVGLVVGTLPAWGDVRVVTSIHADLTAETPFQVPGPAMPALRGLGAAYCGLRRRNR